MGDIDMSNTKKVSISKEYLETLKKKETAEIKRLRKHCKRLRKEVDRLKNLTIVEHLFRGMK